MKKLVVLSGAGMSAESGLQTFRDADGLWEGHDVMEVASVEGWQQNPSLVLDFYNQRRRQLLSAEPNEGHKLLADLEQHFDVTIVTQNVDDLHERAGSRQIIHLHGQLLESKSSRDDSLVYACREDIEIGQTCELGSQLRPNIVWFGEMVPMLAPAAKWVAQADVLLIIGTSMQVYPAASLANFTPTGTPIYYIDPKPAINEAVSQLTNLTVVADTASRGLAKLKSDLLALC
ncbi:NAD-dependent deacylase [Thalassotalea euphylliae]|uniref:NAD-dependent protein deacylase n=1 Tax=Thalassotalea euphylliae TaxID=1655234 RepID=A0A3E0TRJ0_9GAMM|nr:NAD-dependent deacylase [Thalassotalea euphylliae]REL27236.1 NAD-dependent deacylase [Thalassotalea euphylliae]